MPQILKFCLLAGHYAMVQLAADAMPERLKAGELWGFSGLVLANVCGVYCFTSVEAMSIVIMNPLVPLNSNGFAPVL